MVFLVFSCFPIIYLNDKNGLFYWYTSIQHKNSLDVEKTLFQSDVSCFHAESDSVNNSHTSGKWKKHVFSVQIAETFFVVAES